MGCTVDFFCFVTRLLGHLPPKGLLGSHVCNLKYIRHHSDNNCLLSAQSWKGLRASSLPLAELFLFWCFLSQGCFFCETEGCSRPGGRISKLQLITFCGNWEKVEARALYRRGMLVLWNLINCRISDLIDIVTKEKFKKCFLRSLGVTCFSWQR